MLFQSCNVNYRQLYGVIHLSSQKEDFGYLLYNDTFATDLFTSLTLIPFTIVTELLSYELPYDFFVFMFLVENNVQFSVFWIAVIAIDRYLCICRPFLNGNTVFRSKGTVVCVVILAGTFGVFTSLNYSVETVYISDETNMSLN
ncbi:LOW QUALITY PROTEIN: hypothetical protein MAR_034395, partial [Mya arenaria]